MARTVPVSSTQAPGNFVTSALWNAGPAACNTFLTTVPLAQVTQANAQSIPSSPFTAIAFDTTNLDTDGGHSNVTNNSRYTAQVAGWYLVIGVVAYIFASSTTNARTAAIAKNGTTINGAQVQVPATTNPTNTDCMVANLVQLAVGDYVEIQAAQFTGSNLNTATGSASCSMQCIWLHV